MIVKDIFLNQNVIKELESDIDKDSDKIKIIT